MRRFEAVPEPGRRYTVRHGAYVVLPRDGKVLVTLQERPRVEVQLPGGGIDPGESAKAALHREVLEETGWTIADPRRLGAFRRFTFMPEYDIWAEKVCRVYIARPCLRRGVPTEKAHRALWLRPREAADTLGNAGDATFLRRAFGMDDGPRVGGRPIRA